MTGAPIPDGADAVVMVEVTEPAGGDDRVRIVKGVRPGENVRAAAEDVAPGQQVFAAGAEVTPALVGVLASLGRSDVTVIRRPRVGVLSTGDELVEGDRPLQPGEIRESNRPALLASCRAAGFDPVDLGLVPDDDAAITAAIERGVATCDAVLSSGGVSMGDVDLVKVILDRLSQRTFRWMQIAIKPAKPFAFGVLGGVPVFGLPGNPVSSLVSFECLARPGIRQRMGFDGARLWRPTMRATCPDGLGRRPDGKRHFVRVILDENGVRPSGGQGSNILTAMAVANGLALVEDGDGIEPGGEVPVWLLN
jgi:molybdenum cofactor synthesis domain-containing protein